MTDDQPIATRTRNRRPPLDEAPADEGTGTDGIVVLPNFLTPTQLAAMQTAFAAALATAALERRGRLRDQRDAPPYRAGRADARSGLRGRGAASDGHRRSCANTSAPRFELVEAKGWRSLPTRRDFHGWHGDAWYDQAKVDHIPREVKLAVYLTDVKAGAFKYIKGSHGKQRPRLVRNDEVPDVPPEQVVASPGRRGRRSCSTPRASTARACRSSSAARGLLQLPRPARAAAAGRHRLLPLSPAAAQRRVPRRSDSGGPAHPRLRQQDELLPGFMPPGKHGVWQRVTHSGFATKVHLNVSGCALPAPKKLLRIGR